MENPLYVSTQKGLFTIRQSTFGSWRYPVSSADSTHFLTLSGSTDLLIGGNRKGLFLSMDGGSSWKKSGPRKEPTHIRAVRVIPQKGGDDLILAGTQPAGIFISSDQGRSWQICPEVAELRDQYQWNLPYAADAGCVRGFANRGSKLYAAVEQGGVLEADLSVKKWSLAFGSKGDPGHPPQDGEIHPDIHDLFIDPNSPDILYAATGGGLYRSYAVNSPWERVHPAYCRALWIHPNRDDHLVLGSAAGPDKMGEIEESVDGGESWQKQHESLSTPWQNTMVEQFQGNHSHLIALLSTGRLITSSLSEDPWKNLISRDLKAQAIFLLRRK